MVDQNWKIITSHQSSTKTLAPRVSWLGLNSVAHNNNCLITLPLIIAFLSLFFFPTFLTSVLKLFALESFSQGLLLGEPKLGQRYIVFCDGDDSICCSYKLLHYFLAIQKPIYYTIINFNVFLFSLNSDIFISLPYFSLVSKENTRSWQLPPSGNQGWTQFGPLSPWKWNVLAYLNSISWLTTYTLQNSKRGFQVGFSTALKANTIIVTVTQGSER